MRRDENYIRPPNEQRSAVVRGVYGCTWNRCRFCGIYPGLGVEAGDRQLADVLRDIERAQYEWGADAPSVFIGDADPMRATPEDFVEILRTARNAFGRAERITCYGRLATAWIRRAHLEAFREAGLTRIHAGLETGDAGLLRYHRKGISARRAVDASRAIRAAGIELSLYVLLGIGGRRREAEHVAGTIVALNEARPEFVRFRRLWIHPACPLAAEVAAGAFEPQTPEGTVRESRAIVEAIEFPCELEGLHHNLYCPFAGAMPGKKTAILARLDRFLAKSDDEKSIVYGRPSVI
jgi:radical SAM superfamily enzyme YgiQ (UPF0313 family)